MKTLKTIALSLAMVFSIGTFSSSAVAYEEGRTTYSPATAIEMTVDKAKAAKAAIAAGAKGEEVAALIKKASDASKEINANDVVDRNRQRANNHLKKARKAAKNGDMEGATLHLDKGIEGLEALKGML